MIDILIRREDTERHTKERAKERQKQRMEQCCYKPRNTWGHQNILRGKERFSPRESGES